MKKMRTSEEKQALIDQIQKDIKGGVSAKQAIQAAGITDSQYYTWLRAAGKGRRVKSLKTRRVSRPALLTIPTPEDSNSGHSYPRPQGKLIALIGSTSDVQAALQAVLGN